MGESRIRRYAGLLAALLALWTLPACSSGGGGNSKSGSSTALYAPVGGGERPLPWANRPSEAAAPQAPPAQAQPAATQPAQAPLAGLALRVTWEALAVERELFENPRFGRRPQRGIVPTQKIVLVNETHPEAQAARLGRSMRESAGVAVGAISDEDMKTFVQNLERQGFFRLARPTSSVQHLFDDDNARGRITVERGGESMTLLSMRGQGLDNTTKQIPAMYSQVKQAILVLRNRTPTLSVVGARRDPITR